MGSKKPHMTWRRAVNIVNDYEDWAGGTFGLTEAEYAEFRKEYQYSKADVREALAIIYEDAAFEE